MVHLSGVGVIFTTMSDVAKVEEVQHNVSEQAESPGNECDVERTMAKPKPKPKSKPLKRLTVDYPEEPPPDDNEVETRA